MELGFIGLGRMGANMVVRLVQHGEHKVVAWNRSPDPVKKVVEKGAIGASSIDDLISKLPSPKVVWVMVPSGDVTEQMINDVAGKLDKGDIIIDGGNSNFRDSIRRAEQLKQKGLRFMDAGTSGGIWGLQVGYCLMVGGEPDTFKALEPALKTLAPPDGYLHCGPAGSGHFVKMVHNGIEYGMMSAYGEGFEILKSSKIYPQLDLQKISHLWGQGSVVRSWLLELLEDALTHDPGLTKITDYVEDSGEGRWTILEAIAEDVPANVLVLSLFQRFRSRQEESFGSKVLAALRNEFGGHAVREVEGAVSPKNPDRAETNPH